MSVPIWSRKLDKAAPPANRRRAPSGRVRDPWPAPRERGRREVPSMLGRPVPSVIALPAALWVSPEQPKLIGKARSAYSGTDKEP
jgi:hypothetical protein